MYFSTNIHTTFFKHAAHTQFFPPQNAVYFIMLPFFFGSVLFAFYTQGVLKFKCQIPVPKQLKTSGKLITARFIWAALCRWLNIYRRFGRSSALTVASTEYLTRLWGTTYGHDFLIQYENNAMWHWPGPCPTGWSRQAMRRSHRNFPSNETPLLPGNKDTAQQYAKFCFKMV
jgi:hypothetical protein